MNPYETLGAPNDATADQIKAARRALSKRYHPDRKHGDPERMALVNLANDILTDADRRERYDQSGSTKPIQTLQDEIDNNVRQLIKMCLDNNQGMSHAVDHMRGQRQKVTMAIRGMGDKMANLKRRLPQITHRKGGRNLAAEMIEHGMLAVGQSLAEAERDLKMVDLVIEAIADYIDEADKAQPFVDVWGGTSTGTAGRVYFRAG